MFRRFMIVCWVLFSIGAVTGLVGWAGYEYYDAKVHSYAELHNLDPEGIKWDPRNLLEELEDPSKGKPWKELQRLRDIREAHIELTGPVIVLGGMLLLWNILCHTAHWIWQGRKVEKKNRTVLMRSP